MDDSSIIFHSIIWAHSISIIICRFLRSNPRHHTSIIDKYHCLPPFGLYHFLSRCSLQLHPSHHVSKMCRTLSLLITLYISTAPYTRFFSLLRTSYKKWNNFIQTCYVYLVLVGPHSANADPKIETSDAISNIVF